MGINQLTTFSTQFITMKKCGCPTRTSSCMVTSKIIPSYQCTSHYEFFAMEPSTIWWGTWNFFTKAWFSVFHILLSFHFIPPQATFDLIMSREFKYFSVRWSALFFLVREQWVLFMKMVENYSGEILIQFTSPQFHMKL